MIAKTQLRLRAAVQLAYAELMVQLRYSMLIARLYVAY